MDRDNDEFIDDPDLDLARRATLRRLALVVWTVPVIATFQLGGLSMSSAWAQAANARHHS